MTQSTPRVTIEELTSFSEKDAQTIRKLVATLGSTFQRLTDKDLKEITSSPTAHLFVAREPAKNQIIGMATLAVYRIPYLKKAYLDDFVVLDGYQGQGIGSTLMKAIVGRAKTEGAVYLEFTSSPKRAEANKFYQKMGFKKRDTNVYRLNFDK